jgi:peptidoglycan/LPS O-acetylase OafA/YrhL
MGATEGINTPTLAGQTTIKVGYSHHAMYYRGHSATSSQAKASTYLRSTGTMSTSPVVTANAEKSGNAFDALRVAAALAVLYSHSYALYGLPEPAPLAGQTWGSLAVAFFFAVSGFLVCQSWQRDPHMLRFAARRALRIFPGLCVVVLLTALIIGAAFTSFPLAKYLSSSSPWVYIATGVLGLGSPPLTGVFEYNPYPVSTNGSLWTLKYELIMYASLAVFGRFVNRAHLKRVCACAFAFFGSLWLFLTLTGQADLAVPFVWRLGIEIYVARVAYLGAFFFAGASFYLNFSRISLSPLVALGLIIAAVMIPNRVVVMLMLWLAVPYLVIVFAFKAPAIFRKVNGFDYSYGIYIYAFPIQQMLSPLGVRLGWPWSVVLLTSVAATITSAAISWHCIEEPALRLKRFIRARRQQSPTGAALVATQDMVDTTRLR